AGIWKTGALRAWSPSPRRRPGRTGFRKKCSLSERIPGSHETLGAQFLHRVAFVVILGPSGALGDARDLQLLDDFGNRGRVAFNRLRDGPAAQGAVALPLP